MTNYRMYNIPFDAKKYFCSQILVPFQKFNFATLFPNIIRQIMARVYFVGAHRESSIFHDFEA